MAAKAPAEELDVDGIPVRLTNPDKVYFPQLGSSGGTKRHLVEYYRTVALPLAGSSAGALFAAIRDRPTYLQRFPDGIEGEEVYQKRVPKYAPDFVRTCRITFPSGRHADALRVDHPAAIVWAANLGTVTFHPWPSHCADPDHPNELRIDLDPQPGTAFGEARAVAVEVVQPLLSELGYVGWPKTSGGRGIHIYIRIEPRWTFIEVRRSAIAIAREIERRAGGRVTTAWWKEERTAAIFIDYNQTARDRTIASAYSARRTPRATVSTPVTWAELADVEPDDLTIATVPDRLRSGAAEGTAPDGPAHTLEPLLELAARDEAGGLGDLPYPPNYPKMPGEPKRVQPSKSRPDTEGNAPPVGMGLPDLD